MKVTTTDLEGVLVFEPELHCDSRGWFYESFRDDVVREAIGPVDFVQENQSLSHRGVLRGLHYQRPPFAQGKLIRVLAGEVLDVAVDIRRTSPAFGRYVAMVLSAENRRQLWVPRGFAHGFLTLSDSAQVLYKCDAYYAPQADAGVRWNDPALAIDWRGVVDPVMSEKDRALPVLSALTECF